MSNKENTSEEIDLGQLFKLIGDGFNKLFRFVGSIFKEIFHGIILFLLFIQKHFLKFVIAGVIGIAIGWYLDHNSSPIYKSSMIVEPNFNSGQQLYNNVEFYNELAEDEEFKNLSLALKISNEEAKNIKRVYIEAFTDDNQKLKQFSDFVRTLDSSSRATLSYEEYLKNFNNINAKFHKITIEALDPNIPAKCQNAIVRSISNNEYFRLQKSTNDVNLNLNDSLTRKQLSEVDSLKVFYQKLKLIEAEKKEQSSSTSIVLSSENKQLDQSELSLLKEAKSLSQDILSINSRKADTKEIINVISDFPNRAARVNSLWTKKKFILPLIFIGLTFLVLTLFSLNKFLRNYSR